MAALSSFIVTCNNRYVHDSKDGAAVTRWRSPWIRVPRWNSVVLWGVLWAKDMAGKDTHKEMLSMYGENCLSRQAVHNWVQKFSEGWTSVEDKHLVGQPVEIAMPATLQHHRFPGSCEMVGQVFKFVWRLCWKCMLFVCHYPHSFLFNHDL